MIHVITAVHNRYNITEKFVQLLLSQTYSPIHLILVDDGSTDGTAEMVQRMMPSATIIRGNGNLYWGGGMHAAFRWVQKNLQNNKDDYLLLANDDTEFPDDYIERGIEILSHNQHTLIAGVGIGNLSGLHKDGAIQYDFRSSGENSKLECADGSGNCASTRSLFLRIGDYLEIGGFHPILLPHYASDYEWTIRANRKGFLIKSYSQLMYTVHEDTTGLTSTQKITLKRMFSKRSNYNPIYRFIFIFMVTPIRVLPVACKTQIARYLHR